MCPSRRAPSPKSPATQTRGASVAVRGTSDEIKAVVCAVCGLSGHHKMVFDTSSQLQVMCMYTIDVLQHCSSGRIN